MTPIPTIKFGDCPMCNEPMFFRESKETDLVANVTGHVFHRTCWTGYCAYHSKEKKSNFSCPITREDIPKTACPPTNMSVEVLKKPDARSCGKCGEVFKRLLARELSNFVEPIVVTERNRLYHKTCFETEIAVARRQNLYPDSDLMPSPFDGFAISSKPRRISPFTRAVLSTLPDPADKAAKKKRQMELKQRTETVNRCAHSVSKDIAQLLRGFDRENRLLQNSFRGAKDALDFTLKRMLAKDAMIAELFAQVKTCHSANRVLQAANRALQAANADLQSVAQRGLLPMPGAVLYKCVSTACTIVIRIANGVCHVVSESYNSGREFFFGANNFTIGPLTEAPLDVQPSSMPSSRSSSRDNKGRAAVRDNKVASVV